MSRRVASSSAPIVAYTDGGCRGNPGIGGWGFLLIDVGTGRTLERRGGEPDTTNNRMEITAALEALEALARDGLAVEIRTDSKYLKDMAEKWLPGWKRKGWRRADGGKVKNLDLVERLDALLARHRVTWRWVAGHSGEAGNDHVDALTNAAMDAIASGGDGRAERRYDTGPVEVPPA